MMKMSADFFEIDFCGLVGEVTDLYGQNGVSIIRFYRATITLRLEASFLFIWDKVQRTETTYKRSVLKSDKIWRCSQSQDVLEVPVPNYGQPKLGDLTQTLSKKNINYMLLWYKLYVIIYVIFM